MLGRVRPSPSMSLELLELERPPSKFIKHDPLSIYEATLMKLKEGSFRSSSSTPEDLAKLDTSGANISPDEESMTPDANCSSTYSCPSSSDCQSVGTSKQQSYRNASVICMFSRYKSSLHYRSSSDEKAMSMEYTCSSSSTSSSPTGSSASTQVNPSGCDLISSSSQHLQQDCVGPSPLTRG